MQKTRTSILNTTVTAISFKYKNMIWKAQWSNELSTEVSYYQQVQAPDITDRKRFNWGKNIILGYVRWSTVFALTEENSE